MLGDRPWLAELDPDADDAIEMHLFDCAVCTRALEHVAAVGDAVRERVCRGDGVGRENSHCIPAADAR